MALGDFEDLIAGLIQDTADKLSPERRLDALKAAVDEYSTITARHKVATLTGDGVLVTFSLPSDFEEGFSQIESIEYPVGRQTPEYLDQDDYGFYRDPTTGVLKLRLYSLTLGVGVTAYLSYTKRHHVLAAAPVGESSADTVPISDRMAVSKLAASNCALMLAAYYSQTSDPTIGADVVDYRARAEGYITLAKELRDSYGIAVGATDGVVAASAVVDLDVNLQGGMDRFWHPRDDR